MQTAAAQLSDHAYAINRRTLASDHAEIAAGKAVSRVEEAARHIGRGVALLWLADEGEGVIDAGKGDALPLAVELVLDTACDTCGLNSEAAKVAYAAALEEARSIRPEAFMKGAA